MIGTSLAVIRTHKYSGDAKNFKVGGGKWGSAHPEAFVNQSVYPILTNPPHNLSLLSPHLVVDSKFYTKS